MAQLQSFNSRSTASSFGVFQLLRQLGASLFAITVFLVLVGTLIGLSGCAKTKTTNEKAATSSSTNNQAAVTMPPSTAVAEKPAVTARKKPVVRRAHTMAYSNSVYGVSFRFPGEFNLTTSGQEDQTSTLPEAVPANFVQPGGVTLATIELPSGSSTSFFSVSANKTLTYMQCQQFAVPDPNDIAANSPVDSNDVSIPSKASVHAVEFSKVENATEQEDVKYYHHFEPNRDGSSGTCYEFAMGVEQSRVSSKSLDYSDAFDKLDRILATVKINSEFSSPVATTVPSHPGSGLSPE